MIPTADQHDLLARLSRSWPASQRLALPAPGHAVRPTGHPLSGEIEALLRGEAASLPYCTGHKVAWVTVAPSAEGLQAAVGDLRAWVIPSFAWEDPLKPFVAPGEARGTLGTTVIGLSPAGYFRWHSTAAQLDGVAAKLRVMRRLAALRPAHVRERVPSLLELRQQFALALLTGDRDAADAAIRAIDNHQLDSAVNTQLMRVRLRDRFREYEALVADPALETVIRARMPHAVRLAIVRAFYATVMAPLEDAGDPEGAVEAYGERAHSVIGGLLEFCRPGDGPEVLRALAYRARYRGQAEAARALLEAGGDSLRPLLSALFPAAARATDAALPIQGEPSRPAASTPMEPTLADEWHEAVSRGDVRRVQEVGLDALARPADELPLLLRESVRTVLRQTLEVLANDSLRRALERVERQAGREVQPPGLPQSWPEFLDRLRRNEWDSVLRFLRSADRPALDAMGATDFDAVTEALEELLTDPMLRADVGGARVLAEALPIFVEEFVSEPRFPRSGLTPLYTQLLRLWGDVRRGSTFAPDGQALLTLASAVLQSPERDEREVAELVRAWWDARRVPALLPYVVEAVELLAAQLGDQTVAQGLWIDGADLVRREVAAELAPGERALWRRLGIRVGIDPASVEEYIGPEPHATEADADPVAQAGLRKVAIVSLHERAAQEAKAMISERSDANVVVVAEMAAGHATRNAATSDVILFVWSANKHAVSRAFDSVRDKVVYVQGTGAGSIVLALERWAMSQVQTLRMN